VRAVVGRPVPVVANSQGGPFGLAFARTGFARRLVLVSPVDDVGFEPVTAALPAALSELVRSVAADADGAFQRFCAFTASSTFDMLMFDYPAADAAVYSSRAFRGLLRAAFEDGFSCGAAGYAQDTVLAMTAWPAALFAPGVDVRVLYGADDHVHSPDQGMLLASRIRGARRSVVDGAGGALAVVAFGSRA